MAADTPCGGLPVTGPVTRPETFRRIGPDATPQSPRVTVHFDGRALELTQGDNLAAALLEAGIMPFRFTPVSGAPRGPFCMMGACYDCLIEVGGIQRQACMMQVTDGLQIAMPQGKTRAKGMRDA
jgi:predicted molibdopterin-dependent oxidoreductase YjgC